ncbi:MAG TPA: PDZ domain-containing protein [Phycisphaerales bacterium]|nr:PDZ domain-containing protein [Phycisphaerales bacterium]
MRRIHIHAVQMALIAAALCCSAPVMGQSSAQPPTTSKHIFGAFSRGDYAQALTLIDDYLKTHPNDSGMMYNAACACAKLNNPDGAAEWLLKSMKAGFRNFEQLANDPDLASLRDHPIYKQIMEEADKAASARAGSSLDIWLATYDAKAYTVQTDEKRHLTFAAALDETSLAEMRTMLEKEGDQAVSSLFEEWPSYTVLIAVPTPADAKKFFNGRVDVGGIYEHTKKRLVARDIGQALKHEFIHLLHYGQMERLHQRHPLWLQEGLACLYEAYEFDGKGHIKFLPNDRETIVKARTRAGKLMSWESLMHISADEFMEKATSLYPEVRSIFEYLAAQGKLEMWYKVYVDGYNDDNTGISAFEVTFGKKLGEIERDWRMWVLAQSDVDLRVDAGDAALGIRSAELLANDGVQVTDVLPNSGAKRAGLRKGDVIVSVDGKETRSMRELIRLLAWKDVGETVQVRIRRGTEYVVIPVTLTAAYAGS